MARSQVGAFVIGLAALCSTQVHADTQKSGIATWNMGWLMDKQTHAVWTTECAKLGWKSTAELESEGKTLPAALVGLPYCDVHSGMDFRKKECASHNRPDQTPSACRVSPDLADWQYYQRKLDVLKETFTELDKKGVAIVGLQEVTNAAAVEPVLPAGWKVVTSNEVKNTPKIPQHVGVAWNPERADVTDVDALRELSLQGNRPLRPGLTFKATVADIQTEFLVVHMKAGCRSQPLDKPKADAKIDCAAFTEQVPVMETWIDDRQGKPFIILGDFNRSILREVDKYPLPDPKAFGKRDKPKFTDVYPEWNDNDPKGSTIVVLNHPRIKASSSSSSSSRASSGPKVGDPIAGDWFCSETPGIDHIILSATLAGKIKSSGAVLPLLQPQGYFSNGKRLPKGPETVPPSDHCARFAMF